MYAEDQDRKETLIEEALAYDRELDSSSQVKDENTSEIY